VSREGNLWEFLRRTYASADPRSLGILRLMLGSLLFFDLVRRLPDVGLHYSNDGWLTNHYLLFRPMSGYLFSPHIAFSSTADVLALCGVQLVIYVLFTIGYRTKVMHALSAALLIGINSRNVAIENGGFVVLTLLTVWTLFLPLGRRFSVDALLASLRARREGTVAALNDRSAPVLDDRPVISLAVLAVLLQWATIYYFNVVHKTGPEWRNGTAVHYFFQQDRMVTEFGAAVRDYLPLWAIKGMTYGTLVIEAAITVLLVAPIVSQRMRMIAFGLSCLLHLTIAPLVDLGPFSYVMVTGFVTFIPREFWEWARTRLRGMRSTAEVEVDPDNGFGLMAARLLKRLDSLERLRFVENPEVAGLAVSVGGVRRVGLEGLRAACAVLPMPALVGIALRLPGVTHLLRRGFADPERASEYLELESLAGKDEQRDEPSQAAQSLRRALSALGQALVMILLVVGVSQVLVENRAVPPLLKPTWRPAWMEAAIVYPRMFQGWSMFAPSPPTDDGVLVVDGVTKDGRKIDPLTGVAPSFDVQPAAGFGLNQLTGDMHRRLGEPRFEAYLDGLREYVKNYAQRTGRPEDELARFDIYFVEERLPPPGQPHPPATRRKLLSYASPGAK
jgi:hypothetical protein